MNEPNLEIQGQALVFTGEATTYEVFAGVPNVSLSSKTANNVTIRTLDTGAYTLKIRGSLRVNPLFDVLLLDHQSFSQVNNDVLMPALIYMENGGIFSMRSDDTNNSVRYLRKPTAIRSSQSDGLYSSCLIRADAGSTFELVGCSIEAGRASIVLNDGSIVDIEDADIVMRELNVSAQLRMGSNNARITNLGLFGINYVSRSRHVSNVVSGIKALGCDLPIDWTSVTTNAAEDVGYYLVEDYNHSLSNNFAYRMWGNYSWFVNCAQGSDLPVKPDLAHRGLVRYYRDLSVNTITAAGDAVADALVYVPDYDSGARVDYTAGGHTGPSAGANIDYRQDFTTIAQVGEQARVLLAVISKFYKSWNPILYDYRSKHGNESDVFDIRVLSYGYLIDTIQDQSLKGVGVLDMTRVLTVDANITLPKADALERLSRLTIDQATHTITVNESVTLDDLYDAMCAYKTSNVQSQLEYPGIGVMPIRAVGEALKTDMAITVSAGATLSAGVTNTSIQSTRGVTNNGVISCALVGSVENNGALFGVVTGSVTNYAALGAGLVVNGTVNDHAPNDLTDVTITGELQLFDLVGATVTFTGCKIGSVLGPVQTTKINLVNSTAADGGGVTLQYPIVIADVDGKPTSFQVWVYNSRGEIVEDTGFHSLVASVQVTMPLGGSMRIYSQPYGYRSKITTSSSTKAELFISHTPEVFVDTGLDTVTRDLIESHFSSVSEDGVVYVEVDTDLGGYTPDQVLNAMHFFIVRRGFLFAAGSLQANSVDSVELIDGGFRVYSPFFKGRPAASLTAANTHGSQITLPLFIENDTNIEGNQILVRNASGVAIVSALWTKASANVSASDAKNIARSAAAAISPAISLAEKRIIGAQA